MASGNFIIFIVLSKTIASNIMNYKFGSNFGQAFYDYSGSGNHGVNGNSSKKDPYDILSIDRGAYFSIQHLYIKLPPNDIVPKSLELNGDFSILMWFNTNEHPSDYYITWRTNSDSSNFLAVTRTTSNSFNTRLRQPSNLWAKSCLIDSIFTPGKF